MTASQFTQYANRLLYRHIEEAEDRATILKLMYHCYKLGVKESNTKDKTIVKS